jgi:copper chaperone NosL
MRRAIWLLVLTVSAACGGTPSPAAVQVGQDTCGQCRQVINDALLAGQLAAPGERPVLFDDVSCLFDYLARNTRLRAGTIAYVTDHQTGEWIPAATAMYTRNLRLPTPRGSHVVAHGSITTQAADPVAQTGVRVTARELSIVDIPDGTR